MAEKPFLPAKYILKREKEAMIKHSGRSSLNIKERCLIILLITGGLPMVKYFLYILRWTVLAIPGALFFNKVRELFAIDNVYTAMIISQALMGAMVYFIDRLIFTSGAIPIPWEIKPRGICSDCGQIGKCYRMPGGKCCEAPSEMPGNSFRCEKCALKKLQEGAKI